LTKDQIRYNFLTSLKDDLTEVFKVSSVSVERQDSLPADKISKVCADIALEVKKARGEKCLRCWNYSDTVGKSQRHPLICMKCENAIREEKLN
jgi:isoleucyl-tRNA synthetase